MTMHLVRGMTTTRTRKQKSRKKTAAILHEEMLTAKLLKKVGYKPGLKASYDFPNYKEFSRETSPTSNKVVPIDGKKKPMEYTGNVVIGQAYNKGGLQVLSAIETNDPSTGKRR